MKDWFLRLVLTGVIGLASLGFFPSSARAALNPVPQTEITMPQPITVSPGDGDFSDAAFANADQSQFGTLAGGDAGCVLIVVVVVVLVLLFITWLVSVTYVGVEIHGGGEIHEGNMHHGEHEGHHGR